MKFEGNRSRGKGKCIERSHLMGGFCYDEMQETSLDLHRNLCFYFSILMKLLKLVSLSTIWTCACIQARELNFEADALAKDGMHCESLFVELVTVLALFS